MSLWVKNKILSSLEERRNVKRLKLRVAAHEPLDQAIPSQDVPLSGAIIQEKASSYTKKVITENFKASDGCLRSWKGRRNISFKKTSGESNSVTPEMANACKETSLPTLLSNYNLKDMYNADGFGLFYNCMTNKTCQLKSEMCSGGKISKVCITVMTTANAVGDKILMSVIGIPRCFKNVKFLPSRYQHQKKAVWMGYFLKSECENLTKTLREKCPNMELFLVLIFLHLD